MDFKTILQNIGVYVFYTLATLSSLLLSFAIIKFLLFFNEKELLHTVLILLLATTSFWIITFGLSILGKNDKLVRKKEFIDLLHKLPLILLSTFITGLYIMIIFFLLTFMTVSKYGQGGIGGDANFLVLAIIVCLLGVIIISLVMYKVMKTDRKDISLTIYNQFSVLKWTSLIILPFGIWASYYFYHTEGKIAWIAMAIWGFIFYVFYKVFSNISEKVQNHITNANLNRIIHEKKKKIVKEEQDLVFNSVSNELEKLKKLFDENVLTEEEYNIQKKRLLK